MSSSAPGPAPTAIAAILADADSSLDDTLEALDSQIYKPSAVIVVGGAGREVAAAAGAAWHESIRSLLAAVDPAISHVWFLAGGAVPRRDALHALIFESERLEAGVAGSKLLDLDRPESLVSVGFATDVFEVPYSGLDDDELDAGQYDVVRDVAALSGHSLLIRRDLAKGLGGPDPVMSGQAAAIDLSQRARLLGARVVVVPSSEVAVPARVEPVLWEQEAGRIRSMIKAYSMLTLIWALPLRFLIGFAEAVLAPIVGRWTLLSWLRSWLWNVVRLPSSLAARRAVRANAVVGDAELFRFQLRGSATLRSLWGEILDAARARFPSEEKGGISSLTRELRRPAFGVGAAALLFSFLATRQLWSGLPASRFSLPFTESGADAVAAYGGGWNPAGFGSTEQLPPFVGFVGAFQQVVLDSADVAAGVLALAAFAGGMWGMTRLLRTWHIDSVPGIAGGVALMAGPAARTIAGEGHVAALLAIAVLPWALRLAVAPRPHGVLRWAGRILGAGWVFGLMANLSPAALIVPLAALALRAVLTPRDRQSWVALGVGLGGTALAVPLLLPWIGRVDLSGYFRAGEAFWVPGIVLLVFAAVAAAAVILAGPGTVWRVGLWGALLAAGGGLLARTVSEGGGRNLENLGLTFVALGTAAVVGASFEALRRISEVDGVRPVVISVGAIGAIAVVASTLLVVAPGRAGLPGDELTAALRFTGASVENTAAARVLLIGPPETLPGTSRRVQGAAYRVVSAPLPANLELELPPPGPADEALESVLTALIDGEASRPGEALAEFGIRWILAMGETPLSSTFGGQLDVIPLDGLRRPAFLVDSGSAVRAITADGVSWAREGTGYRGEASDAVLVRENSHPGWGLDSSPDDWSMNLDGSSGVVAFNRGPGEQQARNTLLAGLAMFALSGLLRRRWR